MFCTNICPPFTKYPILSRLPSFGLTFHFIFPFAILEVVYSNYSYGDYTRKFNMWILLNEVQN